MVKNERELLQELFPLWIKYADGFIIHDDFSDDGTYEFLLENQKKYNILEILRGPNPAVNCETLSLEKDIRQPLFNAAMKYTSKILILDSDEYFDGNMTKQELETMLDQNPDSVFHFKWIQYTSCNTIRVDEPWKNNYKIKAGSYTQHLELDAYYSHIVQIPRTKKEWHVDANQLFVAHLPWLDKTFSAIKQYFWKTYDYIVESKFKIAVAGQAAVDASVNNFKWEEEYFDHPLKIKSDIFENQSIFDNFKWKFITEMSKKYNIPDLGDWGMRLLEMTPMYFCTVSDAKHFPILINLIGSIHKLHFYETIEISVYDLGMTFEQKRELNNIKKVKICEIEKTNPNILDLIKTNTNREVRGLFSWKPVVIKQALDKYPYVLYLDAGTTILNPINSLFKHIIQNGYFITDCGTSIKTQTPKHIIDKFNLESEENKWLLEDSTLGIEAGFLGIAKSHYNQLILPIYNLSFNINNFVDDGTCPLGWGNGRHDQTLFSILFRQLKLKIYNHDRDVNECFFEFDGKQEPCYLTHTPSRVTANTTIYRSRWNIDKTQYKIHRSKIKRKYLLSAITAIGPSKKYEKFIEPYFENILEDVIFNQIEFIIVYSEWNDIFEKYKHFGNIIFIKEEKATGIFNAFNLGILNTTTEYITNWNIDDLRHPLNMKLKYDMLNKNDDIDLTYNYYVATSTYENFHTIDLKSKTYLEFPDDYHEYVMSACLAGPDPVWRKTMNLFVGMFDSKNYRIAGDWDMWIRFAKNGYKFKLIPEILCIFTIHNNNASGSPTENNDNEILTIRKLHSDFNTKLCNIVVRSAS